MEALRDGREGEPVSNVVGVGPDATGEDGTEATTEDVDAPGEETRP